MISQSVRKNCALIGLPGKINQKSVAPQIPHTRVQSDKGVEGLQLLGFRRHGHNNTISQSLGKSLVDVWHVMDGRINFVQDFRVLGRVVEALGRDLVVERLLKSLKIGRLICNVGN